MPKFFEQLSIQVIEMRQQLPLLSHIDLIQLYGLFQLAIGEVDELREAFGESPENIQEWGMEYHDIIVFLVSLVTSLGVLEQVLGNQRLYSSNGEVNDSNFYEQLTVAILDGQDNPIAFVEAFRLLHSFAHHTHISPQQLFQLMEQTITKVTSNRPPELFQPIDPQSGRELTDEGDSMALYRHLEVMLRLIRKHVMRTLNPSDWQQHRDLLKDWRNSATAQAKLKLRLELQPKSGDFMLEEDLWFSPVVLPSGILMATRK